MGYCSGMVTTSNRKRKRETTRARMERLGITQQAVATELGVSRAAVTQWVTGARDSTLWHAMELAKLLKCRVEDLKPDAKGGG